MTNKNVINGSVQLPPAAPSAMQTVKLLVDKVVNGSVRSREETVPVSQQIAVQWIEANEAEAIVVDAAPAPSEVVQDDPSPDQPRARAKKRIE